VNLFVLFGSIFIWRDYLKVQDYTYRSYHVTLYLAAYDITANSWPFRFTVYLDYTRIELYISSAHPQHVGVVKP
jgi:hypothetical protein